MSEPTSAGSRATSPEMPDPAEQDPSAAPRPPDRSRLAALAAAAASLQACLLLWLLAGDLRQRPVLFLVSYALSFVAYGLLWWYGRGCFPGRQAFWITFALAVLFRVTLLPAQPGLSDDVSMGLKLLLALCDLGVLGLLWWLARGLQVETWNLILYGCNPLVLLEVAGSGHDDGVALLFLLAALGLILRGQRLLTSLALAGALLAKVFPVFLLATFVRRIPSRVLWPLPVVLAVGYLAGWPGSEGLSRRLQHGQHNDVLFRWILAATEWVQPQKALTAAVDFVRGLFADTEVLSFLYDYTQPGYVARMVAGLLILAVAVFVSFMPWHPTRETLVALTALLLLSPVVHPWYLLWFAPLLALHPSRGLLLWTALVPLSYFLAATDALRPASGGLAAVAQYLPVLAVLVWELRRARRRGLPVAGCLV